MKTIAFLGCGNMGGAMIKAIADKKICNIRIYDRDKEKLEYVCNETGSFSCKDETDVVMHSDLVFVAVKPDAVYALINKVKDVLKDKIIISIAAGVNIKTYTDILGNNISLVRSIPNLPAMVGEGMTGLFYYNVKEEDKVFIEELFGSFGKSVTVNKESFIDEMIAVTSSSPAYICLFAEALADGAVRAGFSRKDAYTMALQTIYGTSKMLLEKNIHPAILKDQVCSPGGTTIEGVAELEKTGFRNSVLEAMKAVSEKVKKINKG